MVLEHTLHSLERLAQRNLSQADIAYVMQHGRVEHRAGTAAYFLGKRDIPHCDRRDQRIAQLEGTTVVLIRCGGKFVVLTAYRNRQRGLKNHRKKSKCNRRN